MACLVQELQQLSQMVGFCLLLELQRWEVCYQQGLPHLVSIHSVVKSFIFIDEVVFSFNSVFI